jgi:Putative DNA-binding domain
VGSIHQSVTSFDRDGLVGLSRQSFSNLRADDVVSAHCRTSPIEIFPVIRRLVGELSFRIVARRFMLNEPPSVPIPLSYGDNFPGFLRNQGTLASIEYVADIAELEMARGRARYAADARPLAAAGRLPQSPDGGDELGLELRYLSARDQIDHRASPAHAPATCVTWRILIRLIGKELP